MIINGVDISYEGFEDNPSLEELTNYVEYVKERVPEVTSITVKMCPDGKVDINWSFRGTKFERIRRITGYLVGTTDRWNDSKQAEEKQRVKHSIEGI